MNSTAKAADRNVQAQTAKIIPFRKAELLLVNHEGQPFVPMKPVVEGMGLSWQGQHVKLTSGRFQSCVTEIVIQVSGDRQGRPYTCLPLRKLTGWLMSIHPNKVRPELRDGIIAYQNECDDVLWSYWNDGMAVRTHDRSAMTLIDELIGMTEVNVIKGLIRDKAKVVPIDRRRGFQLAMHNRLHTRFNVPRVELIPAQQFEAACNFVAAYALEGEWLPREEKQAGGQYADFTIDWYSAQDVSHLLHHVDWVMLRWHQGIADGVKALSPELYSSTFEHFREVKITTQRLEDRLSGLIGYFKQRNGGLRPSECVARGLAA